MTYKCIGALIENQSVFTMRPSGSVLDAARGMANAHVGAVPILGDAGELVGLFTERDLLNRVVAKDRDPASVRLDEVMTRDPITIRSDQSLVDALDAMFQSRIRHLPVMDDSGTLVGVMSCRDVPASYQMLRERWEKWRARPEKAA